MSSKVSMRKSGVSITPRKLKLIGGVVAVACSAGFIASRITYQAHEREFQKLVTARDQSSEYLVQLAVQGPPIKIGSVFTQDMADDWDRRIAEANRRAHDAHLALESFENTQATTRRLVPILVWVCLAYALLGLILMAFGFRSSKYAPADTIA